MSRLRAAIPLGPKWRKFYLSRVKIEDKRLEPTITSAIAPRPVNAGLRDECHVEYPDDFPFVGQLVVVCVGRLPATR